jgi:uncharacterized alkaline shock family protein YloU
MMVQRQTQLGTLRVHDDVIIAVVEDAVLNSSGVAHLVARGVRDELNQWLKKDDRGRGVSVASDDGDLRIDVFVAVYYGQRLADVGRQLVDQITKAMQAAFGIAPSAITIHVEELEVAD